MGSGLFCWLVCLLRSFLPWFTTTVPPDFHGWLPTGSFTLFLDSALRITVRLPTTVCFTLPLPFTHVYSSTSFILFLFPHTVPQFFFPLLLPATPSQFCPATLPHRCRLRATCRRFCYLHTPATVRLLFGSARFGSFTPPPATAIYHHAHLARLRTLYTCAARIAARIAPRHFSYHRYRLLLRYSSVG